MLVYDYETMKGNRKTVLALIAKQLGGSVKLQVIVDNFYNEMKLDQEIGKGIYIEVIDYLVGKGLLKKVGEKHGKDIITLTANGLDEVDNGFPTINPDKTKSHKAREDDELPEYDVFLSHSEQDEKLIKKIDRALKTIELQVYLEEYETNFGDDVVNSVCKAIKDSACILVILTEQSINSQWVNQEIGYAKALKRQIIPVRIGNINVVGMISNIKRIPSKGGDDEIITNILNFFIKEWGVMDISFVCEKCGKKDQFGLPTQESIFAWEKQEVPTELMCKACGYNNKINPKTLLSID